MTPEMVAQMQEGVNTLATLIGSLSDVAISERGKLVEHGFGDEAADAGGIAILKSGLTIMLGAVTTPTSVLDV